MRSLSRERFFYCIFRKGGGTTVKVNGKDYNFKENTSISDLLQSIGVKKDVVVVEVNLEIIENEMYDNYILKEDDIIEVIRFVGGG